MEILKEKWEHIDIFYRGYEKDKAYKEFHDGKYMCRFSGPKWKRGGGVCKDMFYLKGERLAREEESPEII